MLLRKQQFPNELLRHPETELTHLRWSMHRITLPKVPSPKVLTISSATQYKEKKKQERESGGGGGKEALEMWTRAGIHNAKV